MESSNINNNKKRFSKDLGMNHAKSMILSIPNLPVNLTRSISNGKKSHRKAQKSIDSKNNEDEDDVGKLKMGKSVISLLTTTSIYSEFNKFAGNASHIWKHNNHSASSEITEEQDENQNIDEDLEAEEDEDEDDDDELDEKSQNEILQRLTDFSIKLDDKIASTSVELSPLEKSVVRSLESKRKLICGPQSVMTTSSNRNINVRAVALSNKLMITFNISPEDELLDDYSCWLLRDVLLQGHLYITKHYLLFFAYLPNHQKKLNKKSNSLIAENTSIYSGNLSVKKRSISPVKQFQRYWCVLKGSTFSVYTSATDLYFPFLTIDLRYVIKVEVVYSGVNSNHNNNNNTNNNCHPLIKVPGLSIHSESNNELSIGDLNNPVEKDDNFIKELRTRESTISNPKSIVNRQKIRILTEDKSYIFYADNLTSANAWVSHIKTQIFSFKNHDDKVTVKLPLTNVLDVERNPIFENAENIRIKVLENSETYALDDYFFLFFNSCATALENINKALEYSQIEKNQKLEESKDDFDEISGGNSISDNYYPSEAMRETESIISEAGSNLVINDDDDEDVVEKQKISSSKLSIPTANSLKNLNLNPTQLVKSLIGNKISNGIEMWSSNPTHYEEVNSLELGKEDKYFESSSEERNKSSERFRKHFTLPPSEKLIATYYAYLQRNIPLYGKIYLGSNKICFRSLIPGINTKMILPLSDVENCYKEKNFSFGYSGLVVVINGHEELFFEFSANESRDDCEYLLFKQLDHFKRLKMEESNILLNDSIKLSSSTINLGEAENIRKNEEKINSEIGNKGQVPIIIKDFAFAKESFKPDKSYKITCLTIGSRGDVQPYLALCKKLIADGHRPRIATHGEFKEVVEKYGIEFKEIAGSPTELMSFMGAHGSISVSFLKNAKSKFSSWIDELLITSWEACQDSDILIESPSAMAGIHIAEALNIPYFRAFTMPWTRTRAYPHAFIVPESKKGGSYNYFTHVMFENVFWKGISGQVNRWRKETLGLSKTDLFQLQQNKVPFLYNISPTVFPPSVDFADWVTVTGYWFLDEKLNFSPSKELVEFMNGARKDGKKLIYIGFGSIVVSDPKELTAAVIKAVQKADVRCILNKGWSNRLEEDNEPDHLPPEVFNSGSIPHDWLFSQIDAAVHHGGSGTTGASLRAGLPTIIKPFFGDQFFYAHRVEDMNVGIYLKKLNKDSLSKAIKEVTTDQRIIEKAKIIGENIRKENGVEVAIEKIWAQLEYSQSLISHKYSVSKLKSNQNLLNEEDDEIGDIDDFRKSSTSSSSKSPRRSSSSERDKTHSKSISSWLLL